MTTFNIFVSANSSDLVDFKKYNVCLEVPEEQLEIESDTFSKESDRTIVTIMQDGKFYARNYSPPNGQKVRLNFTQVTVRPSYEGPFRFNFYILNQDEYWFRTQEKIEEFSYRVSFSAPLNHTTPEDNTLHVRLTQTSKSINSKLETLPNLIFASKSCEIEEKPKWTFNRIY